MSTRRSQQKIRYKNQYIAYELLNHPKARYLKLAVGIGGKITVTKPKWVKQATVETFIREKQPWITERTESLAKKYGTNENLAIEDRAHFLRYKERAERFCEEKVSYWNRKNKFSYNMIRVKQLRASWGICSSNRNITFNYKIIFLPKREADKLIVHELCHLKEMNHSKRFWDLVEKTLHESR
ncbi:MAG: DUF45 domain-containing protein [Candidatus Kaiserbacteria bacterium]|nr:DUF45 domain-containing protein [Candidatus Kaiserbacteria bacterium]